MFKLSDTLMHLKIYLACAVFYFTVKFPAINSTFSFSNYKLYLWVLENCSYGRNVKLNRFVGFQTKNYLKWAKMYMNLYQGFWYSLCYFSFNGYCQYKFHNITCSNNIYSKYQNVLAWTSCQLVSFHWRILNRYSRVKVYS